MSGGLKAPSASIFLHQVDLQSDNPTIIRSAAGALEQLVGTRSAVQFIVESAALAPHHDCETTRVLSNALRFIFEGQERGQEVVVAALEEAMESGDDRQQLTARRLLSEMGGAQASGFHYDSALYL